LYKNLNALSSTYIGNQNVTAGKNAFSVTPMSLNTDPLTELGGMPTFSANISGIA